MAMEVRRSGSPCCSVWEWHEIPSIYRTRDELSMPKAMLRVGNKADKCSAWLVLNCCCIEIEGKGLTSVQQQSDNGFERSDVVIHQSVKDNALYVVNQICRCSVVVSKMDANNAEARKHAMRNTRLESSMCLMQK
jgi:hypothetical protein